MNKRYTLHKLFEFGDAVIHMKNGRDFLATIDFNNNYIKKVKRPKFGNLKRKVLVFNYTDWCFESIVSDDIVYITPLANILKNESPNITVAEE